MKRMFWFLLLVVMLSGCRANANNAGFSEIDQLDTEISTSKAEEPSTPPLPAESTSDETAKELPSLGNVSIEYYKNSSVQPELKTSGSYPSAEIEKIVPLCIEYYLKFEIFLDDNGIPKELSSIRIYELPERDDLIVITGDMFFQWPGCFLFTYKNGELAPFPDTDPFEESLAEASEIRLLYDQGFPFPVLEISDYSHRGNGFIGIYRFNGDCLEFIAGEICTGLCGHNIERAKESPVFADVKFPEDEGDFFYEQYRNGHLTPSYMDVDEDGYVDIVFSGFIQCEDRDGNVFFEQEIRRAYLYHEAIDRYVFNTERCIRSELEEYLFDNAARRVERGMEDEKRVLQGS